MRNIFFLLIFLYIGISTFAKKSTKKYDMFLKEIYKFIDTCKSRSYYSKNYVYYIALYDDLKEDNSYCFMMTYIYNWYQIKLANNNYLFKFKDEYVILDLNKAENISWLAPLNYLRVDSNCKLTISAKLIQKPNVLSGHPKGMICCYKNDTLRETFYDDASNMPTDLQINKFPDDIKIRQVPYNR